MTVAPNLVRVPLTLAAAVAFHVSMSPPSQPVVGDRRAVHTAARCVAGVLTKGFFWASTLTDVLPALVPYAPVSFTALLTPISLPSTTTALFACVGPLTRWTQDLILALPTSFPPSLPYLPVSLSLATIAGTTLALAGAYLRYAAYDALGQFYACPNRGSGPGHTHALITTGPYAHVRHPGYAGLVLCTAGLVVLHFDGWDEGVGRLVWASTTMRSVALACAILAVVGALRRIRDEERTLRARFKMEWDAWAARVPYRLVPGVY